MSENGNSDASRKGEQDKRRSVESQPPTHFPPKHKPGFRPSRTASWEMKLRFLRAYEDCGVVSEAAKRVGINRRSHVRWMERSPRYREKFAEAQQAASEKLFSIARHRATIGTAEKLWYKGQPIIDPETEEQAVLHRPSDALMLALLRAEYPEKFSTERHEHTGTISVEAVNQLLIGIVQVAREYVPPTLIEEFIDELARIGTDSVPILATAEVEEDGEESGEDADELEYDAGEKGKPHRAAAAAEVIDMQDVVGASEAGPTDGEE